MVISGKPQTRSTILTACVLLAFFIAVYSLFYSGTFLTDDEHILSARTLNFAFDDSFNISRVIGNSRVFEFSTSTDKWASETANIEPGQALVGSLLVKLALLLNVGRIQMLFLLNLWATALTAVILFITAIKLNYSRWIGFILAGLFGFATIAFPYVRTYFRDPLAMLVLACAWMFAQCIGQPGDEKQNSRSKFVLWLGFVGFSIAGILTKNTVALAIPVLLLEIIIRLSKNRKVQITRSTWIKLAIAAGFIMSLVLLWIFIVPRVPKLARFSPGYYFSLVSIIVVKPHPNLLQAITGPFISPGKSIFLFSPVLLLSLWSLIFHFRSAWSAWLYLLLLVIFQGLFYDAEWAGHVNWGLRYTLPAIPPLILAAAPTINGLIKKFAGRTLIILVAIISICIQIMGAVVPMIQFFIEKSSAIPHIGEYSTIWQAKQSILVWCMDWIFQGKPLDLAILRNPRSFWLIMIAVLLLGAFTIFCMINRKFQYGSVLAIIGVIGLNIGMMYLFKNDPAYYSTRKDLSRSQTYLVEHIQPEDLVLIKSYGSPIWFYWMNWGDDKVLWTALPYYFPTPTRLDVFNLTKNPEDALNSITLSIFNQKIKPGQRTWLQVGGDSPGASLGIEILWLEGRSDNHECQNFADNGEITKLCYFDIR
jgi:hypothetical protein